MLSILPHRDSVGPMATVADRRRRRALVGLRSRPRRPAAAAAAARVQLERGRPVRALPVPAARARDRVAARAELSPATATRGSHCSPRVHEQALAGGGRRRPTRSSAGSTASPPTPAHGRAARLLAGRRDGARAAAPRPRAIRVRREPRRASRCPATATATSALAQVAPPVFWGRGTADGVIAEASIAHTHRLAADARRRSTSAPTRASRTRSPRSSSSDAAAFIAKHLAAPAYASRVVAGRAARPARRGARPPRRPRRRPTRDRALRAPCRAR